jgi:hypothetical protein
VRNANWGSHQVAVRMLEVGERVGFGHGQQVQCGAERARLDLGPGSGQRPCRPLRRVDR